MSLVTFRNPVTQKELKLQVGVDISNLDTAEDISFSLQHQYARSLSLTTRTPLKLVKSNGEIWATSQRLKDANSQSFEVVTDNIILVRMLDLDNNLLETKSFPKSNVSIQTLLSENSLSSLRRTCNISLPYDSYDVWFHTSNIPYFHHQSILLSRLTLTKQKDPLPVQPDAVNVLTVVQIKPYSRFWKNVCLVFLLGSIGALCTHLFFGDL